MPLPTRPKRQQNKATIYSGVRNNENKTKSVQTKEIPAQRPHGDIEKYEKINKKWRL